jgi:hypothetical protein
MVRALYSDAIITNQYLGGSMQKNRPVRLAVAAAVACSFGLAIMLPGAMAGAVTHPAVTVTCTGLLGNSTQQLESGCVGSGSPTKFKGSSYGVAVPNGSDTGATIYWTDKATTTISFTYATETNTCPTYLGVAASLEEQETATVTGGTAKLTLETGPPSNVCIYLGSDSTILVNGDGSYTI